MIKHYEKFRLIDENKENDFFAEVNWEDNNDISNCKIIKFTFPDGTESLVKKELLNSLLFVIGDDKEQSKIVPYIQRKTRWYNSLVGVKATKDIRKGEMVNFEVKFPLDSIGEEYIGDIKSKLLTNKKRFIK